MDDDASPEMVVIERMALADSARGQEVSAAFVARFAAFMRDDVRPVLRQMASDGDEPQLLVNGVAELLRLTADSIEFPLGADRHGPPA